MLTAPVRADLIPALQIDEIWEDVHNDFAWTLGFSFLVHDDIAVGGFGYYDAGADGLLEDHLVGLWTEQGELLASASVGNAALLDGWFRWQTIAPVQLSAGHQYIVAGLTAVDDYTYEPYVRGVHEAIEYRCARYGFGEALTFPEESYQCFDEWSLFGFFGANFLILDDSGNEPPVGVPAPGALWLMLLAGLVMLVRSRHHAARRLLSPLNVCIVLGGGATAFSPTGFALDATGQATQGAATWDSQVPLGTRYQRYSHEYVGGIIEYDNVFDADGNYLVPVGEKLRWVWQRKGVGLSYLEMTYVGGTERCWQTSQGSQFCAGPSFGHNRFLGNIRMRCQPESETDGDYLMLLYRNGILIDSHPFGMERFKMKTMPSMWTYPTQLRPKRYRGKSGTDGDGEQKQLSFRVSDDLGCGAALEKVEITIQSHPVPGSNHHDHFKAGDKGLGKFVAVSGHAVALSVDNTKAEGKTNSSGLFAVDYRALDFAAEETVKLTFRRPAKDSETEQKQSASLFWTIKMGDYVQANPYPHDWLFGGGCGHGEEAKYLRADVWPLLLKGLNNFYYQTGQAVLLNDGSFAKGGAVDTLRACSNHASHRMGNDIDINDRLVGQQKRLLRDKWSPGFEFPPEFPPFNGVPLVDVLTAKMKAAGFCKAEEEPIHYRIFGKC